MRFSAINFSGNIEDRPNESNFYRTQWKQLKKNIRSEKYKTFPEKCPTHICTVPLIRSGRRISSTSSQSLKRSSSAADPRKILRENAGKTGQIVTFDLGKVGRYEQKTDSDTAIFPLPHFPRF